MLKQATATFSWNANPEHFWIRLMLGCVLVFNLLDASFTLFWVCGGMATEANPLMELLLSHSPVLFVLCKTALVGLGCQILWSSRRHWLSFLATCFAFSVYGLLIFYHLLGLLVAVDSL